MTALAGRTLRQTRVWNQLRLATWLVTVGLFGLALAARFFTAGEIPFAVNEGSASYLGVSRNLIEGRGLVSDAIRSYATPQLILPKPAFETWIPMASLLAAVPMAVLGTERGRYPAAWFTAEGAACLSGPPEALLGPDDPALLFRLRADCLLL